AGVGRARVPAAPAALRLRVVRGVLLGRGDLPGPGPTNARHRTRPQTGAVTPPERPRSPNMSEAPIPDAREQLVDDMKAVMSDAEERLRAAAGATGEKIGAIRARAEETLKAARRKLATLDDVVIDQAREAARSADHYVREHPWGAVGIAAVAGLVLGVLI